jgi:hypothetical protein
MAHIPVEEVDELLFLGIVRPSEERRAVDAVADVLPSRRVDVVLSSALTAWDGRDVVGAETPTGE